MRDLTKKSIINTLIKADLTFILKNDNSNTTGKSNMPSEVIRKNDTFSHCNDFFIPKKVLLTAIDIIVLTMKYVNVMPRNIAVRW